MGRALVKKGNPHLFRLFPQHPALKEEGKYLIPANDGFKHDTITLNLLTYDFV